MLQPESWDENAPLKISDPEARKPEDWDDEDDGEWKPPLIDNPACQDHGCGPWTAPLVPNPLYKGKWKPDLIDNPDYDGVWAPRQIPNSGYFTTDDATKGMAMITDVAFEIWTMQNGIEFDNIYVGHSVADADQYAKEFQAKHEREVAAHAEFAPSQPEASRDGSVPAEGLVAGHFQKLIELATPYLGPVSDNPLPFIFTFLAGILVFAIYMYKQAGSATERMQQAKASKAAPIDKQDRQVRDSSSADNRDDDDVEDSDESDDE